MADNTVKITLQVADDGSVKILDQIPDKIKKASAETESWTSVLKQGWFQVTALTAAVGLAINKIDSFARSQALAADEILRNAKTLGMNSDAYQRWVYIAHNSGVTADELVLAFKNLSVNIENASQGTGRLLPWLNAMGISFAEAKRSGDPFNYILDAIRGKFASYEDGEKKMTIATEAFGRGSQRMVDLLSMNKTGFSALTAEADKFGVVTGETIKKLEEANRAFERAEAAQKKAKMETADWAEAWANLKLKAIEAINFIRNEGSDRGWLGPFNPPKKNSEWPSETRFKYNPPKETPPELNEAQLKIQNEYAIKTVDLMVDSTNKTVAILEAWRKKALEEATKTGIGRKEITEYYEKAITKVYQDQATKSYEEANKARMELTGLPYEVPSPDQSRMMDQRWIENQQKMTNAIRDSKLEEAQLGGNIYAVAAAEREVFEAKLQQMQLTPDLEKQLRITFDLAEAEKKRLYWSQFNPNAGYETPPLSMYQQKGIPEVVYQQKKAVADVATAYAELTGNLQEGLKVYAVLLSLEEQNIERLVSEGKASQDLLTITRNLNEEKMRRKEAETNLNIPALYDIGMTNAAIKGNQDLANQYMNFLPNSIDVFTNSIRQCDGNFSKFFENAAQGFLKMGEDILATILKMEILKALGYGSGNVGSWGSMLFGGRGFDSSYTPWVGPDTFEGVGSSPGSTSRSQARGGQPVVNYYDNSTKIQTVVTEDAHSWEERRGASIRRVVDSGNRLLTPGRRR